jgi:hypothetical protein
MGRFYTTVTIKCWGNAGRCLLLVLFLRFVPVTPVQSQVTDTLLPKPVDSIALIKLDTLQRKPFVLFDSLNYRFMGDGNFTRGNINRTLVILRSEIMLNGPVVSLTTNPRFTYGEQKNFLAERDTYIDLFIDIHKERKIYGFGLATVENSNLRGIELRRLAGIGVGLRLFKSPHNALSITNAIIYESTDFRERPTLTTQRNSTRLKGKHTFMQQKLRLSHITFVQPALNNFSNLRWNTIISLEMPLSKWVTMRTSYENSFESVVEANRKQHDSRLTFGVAFGNRP